MAGEQLQCLRDLWDLSHMNLMRKAQGRMPSKPRVDRIKICYTAAMHLNDGWRMRGYPSTPFNNAVTNYMPQLHRVTIRFCRKNECSAGVRDFISRGLLALFASQNPSVVVYVQPVRQNIPILRGEYGNGHIIQIIVKNFDAEQVGRNLNLLRTRSGLPVADLFSRQSATVDSVQGMWNPMLSVDPEMNTSQLPQPKFSRHRSAKLSATEYFSSLVNECTSDAR